MKSPGPSIRRLPLVLLLAAVGCPDDAGPPDPQGATNASADASDGEDGGLEPTADCVRYLACVTAADPENTELYESMYGTDGECWSEGTGEALQCTMACQAGHEETGLAHPTLEECWPTDLPEAHWVFGMRPVWHYSNTSGACFDMVATYTGAPEGPNFTASIVFSSGAVRGFDCTLDAELAFACKTDADGVLSGRFDAALSNSQVHRDYLSDYGEDVVCDFDGVPGVG